MYLNEVFFTLSLILSISVYHPKPRKSCALCDCYPESLILEQKAAFTYRLFILSICLHPVSFSIPSKPKKALKAALWAIGS